MKTATIFAVIFSTLVSPLQADCRRARVCVPHKAIAVVAHKQIIAAPIVDCGYGYQVGVHLREDALIQKAIKDFYLDLQEKGLLKDGTPSVGPSPATARSELENKVRAIIGSRCAMCHTGDAPNGGGLDLSDLGKLSGYTKHRMEFLARKGRMPKGGPPIPDEEATLLEAWIDQFDAE